MKTFKQYTKEKSEDEKLDGILDVPIHFKYVDEAPQKLSEAKKTKSFDSWFAKHDNKHLSKNNNHKEISKKLLAGQETLTKDQHNSLYDYTSYSRNINKALVRNGGQTTAKNHTKMAEGLDSAIASNPIKKKLHVYSAIRWDPRTKVGENGVFKSPAYISTTHRKDIAADFAEKKYNKKTGQDEHHYLHITLKPGDPAIHVGPNSRHHEEAETIIQRNTRLKLKKTVTHAGDSYDHVIHVHHMEVVK